MKTEIRIAASNIAHEIVKSSIANLVPVLVAKKEGYALDTGMKDENGKPIYAVIDITVKNTEDNASGTAKGFNLEEAVQALQDKMNAPKKVSIKKETDPEAEAKRAANAERQDKVEQWCITNLTDTPMTATDIQKAIPELEGIAVMQVGTYLKNIVAKNPVIQREQKDGKWMYTHI